MKTLTKTIQEVLQNYDYLHLYAITGLVKNEWWFGDDIKKPEDIINALILEDIKTNGVDSTFIKVWLEQYALRKESEIEILFSFLKCRLNNFPFWELNHHDIKYSTELFWKDIFSEPSRLLSMLDALKSIWKINSYTPVSKWQIIIWLC